LHPHQQPGKSVPADIDIADQDEVLRWLSNKPRDVAVVFATRAALRVVPLLADALGPRGGGAARVGRHVVLPVFRVLATQWVAGRYSTYPTEAAKAAEEAATGAEAAARAADATSVAIKSRATNAAYAAAYAARAAAVYPAHAAAQAARATAAAYAAAALGTAAVANAAYGEVRLIDNGAVASALAASSLWPAEVPGWALDAWQRLEEALLKEHPDWRVWTDWYRARLEGKDTTGALEFALALIADETWGQGPRAVNAEIARLIAKYGGAPDEAPQGALPDVPAQRPAAVKPIWRGRLLTLPEQPAARDLSDAEFVAALAALRDDLCEFVDDLSGDANIDKRLLSYLRRLADRIPQALPLPGELFRLGHDEEIFVGYAETVNREWPEFPAVRYHKLKRQYERTMKQSPLWRDFISNAAKATLTPDQVKAAGPLAATAAKALRQEEARAFVDAPVPAALEGLIPGRLEPPFDAIEAGSALLAADLVESVNNVLKPVAEAALTAALASGRALGKAGTTLARAGLDYVSGVGEGIDKAAKEEGPKDGEKAFKWLRRLAIAAAAGVGAAGAGVFAELGQLIAKFPEAFEWLERVLHFIR
jgi:hypothetical protein